MNVFKTSIGLLLFSILFMVATSCSNHDEVLSPNHKEQVTDKSTNSNVYSRMENMNEEDYQNMMSALRNDIDNILLETKPEDLSLYDYKVKLVKGEMNLPQESQNRITNSSQNLISYGRNLAVVNNVGINTEDNSELLTLGGLFSPGDNLGVTFPGDNLMQVNGNVLTWGEVAECVAVGIGADAIWALGGSSATAWTAAALTRAFAAVAKRFLGPIGVAIAVVSFGVCIVQQAND